MPGLWVVYTFRHNRVQRQLVFQRVTEALYTMLLDVHRQRAEPVSLAWGDNLLYDAAALQRIYARCRVELDAAGGGVPPSLVAAAHAELRPAAPG
jgi:hypothetical protein